LHRQMMMEIEVKAPLPDVDRVRDRVSELGGRDFGTSFQVDEYYAHPTRDFAVTDEALRLRTENDLTVITYKGPKLDRETKTREEFEVSVANRATMASILDRLGFRPVIRISKKRQIFGLRGITVCFDSVAGLGDYIELEVDGEDVEAGKKAIFSLMEEIGVSGNERRSYLELLMERARSGPEKMS
jgi:adenylate cyclase, class 2